MGNVNDIWYQKLGDWGFTGALNDRFFKFWGALGLTGAYTDRLSKWKALGRPDFAINSPASLFHGQNKGFWLGTSDPSDEHVLVSSTTPAALPGESVYQVNNQVGSVDAGPQSSGALHPTLVRWPKGGRHNLVTFSELPNDLAQGGLSGGNVSRVDMAGFDGAAYIEPATTTTSFSYRQVFPLIEVGVPIVLSFIYEADDGLAPNIGSSADGYVAPAMQTVTTTDLGGGRWRVVGKGIAASTNFYGMAKATSANARAYKLTAFQVVLGTEEKPYQKVVEGSNVTEAGVPDLWHLYNDGSDVLPLPLPEGIYNLAFVDHLGQVTFETVSSDGTTPLNALRTPRMADLVLRNTPFTLWEEDQLVALWEDQYK